MAQLPTFPQRQIPGHPTVLLDNPEQKSGTKRIYVFTSLTCIKLWNIYV